MSTQFITQGAGAGQGIPITVALPQYPNVPLLPGVPLLPRSLLFPPSPAPSIGTEANSGALWQSTQTVAGWGVLNTAGNPVVNPDSIADYGWRQELRLPNFPIQAGKFANYNRVILPFEASITLTKGGSLPQRTAFLQEIDVLTAPNNIALYTIMTPEKTYLNCSVTRAELSRRGAANANYFDVELFFIQIVQVTAQYSSSSANTSTANASVPSAIPAVNSGQSNPQTPTPSVQAAGLQAAAAQTE